MEWWSFESNILLSGLLPGARLNVGVMGMCLNITSMVNMVPRGIAGTFALFLFCFFFPSFGTWGPE
jgi:hypothetical protein